MQQRQRQSRVCYVLRVTECGRVQYENLEKEKGSKGKEKSARITHHTSKVENTTHDTTPRRVLEIEFAFEVLASVLCCVACRL